MSTDFLQAAQEALSRGERIHARKLARSALLQNPRSEQAWLLMARVVDQPQQVLDCLEQAHKINPNNPTTLRALGVLTADCQFCGAHHELDPETLGFAATKNV